MVTEKKIDMEWKSENFASQLETKWISIMSWTTWQYVMYAKKRQIIAARFCYNENRWDREEVKIFGSLVTCLGVTQTVGFGVQACGIQDDFGDLLRVGFLSDGLRSQYLVSRWRVTGKGKKHQKMVHNTLTELTTMDSLLVYRIK